jgi:hypothetical protein
MASIKEAAMPTLTLSPAALALFRLHVERSGQIAVDDQNREPYLELERAGLVMNSRPFAGDHIYALTREGFERKAALLGRAREST